RAHLLLAKMLRHGGNLLVLDEPTNDLDLSSLRMLEDALAGFTGSVLVVSHDRYFLDRICDRMIAIEDGAVLVQTGNYSYYLEKRAARRGVARAREDSGISERSELPRRSEGGRVRKLTYAEQREFAEMEKRILEKEREITEMEGRLKDPAYFVSSPHEAAREAGLLGEVRAELDRLYERWSQLEAIKEGAAS
ncbi:MAG: ABC transporter ATP-binding protein, partial [Verrucomicrobiia bacterium]